MSRAFARCTCTIMEYTILSRKRSNDKNLEFLKRKALNVLRENLLYFLRSYGKSIHRKFGPTMNNYHKNTENWARKKVLIVECTPRQRYDTISKKLIIIKI